jgi:hypothetical protein
MLFSFSMLCILLPSFLTFFLFFVLFKYPPICYQFKRYNRLPKIKETFTDFVFPIYVSRCLIVFSSLHIFCIHFFLLLMVLPIQDDFLLCFECRNLFLSSKRIPIILLSFVFLFLTPKKINGKSNKKSKF